MYSNIEEVTLDGLKSKTTMIHYFGLGFIQVKLGEVFRLHVYTPDLPSIVDPGSVHNHRYAFMSTVLAGALSQDLYDVIPAADVREATHILEDDACTEGVKSDRTPEQCRIRLTSSQYFVAGSRYLLHEDTYHTVDTTNNAITILRRDTKKKEYAQVVRPLDAPHVCPFSKKLPEDELWERVEAALRAAQ